MSLPIYYWLQAGDDLCHEMTLNWMEVTDGAPDTELAWRMAGGTWQTASGDSHLWPWTGPESSGDEPRRLIHRVKLDGLTPGTAYQFQFDGDADTLWFRTLPDALSPVPVRITLGGDIQAYEAAMDRTHEAFTAIAARDPDALAIKGDFTNADDLESRFDYWDEWCWDVLVEHLTRPDGRVIPIIPAIGNHEVAGGYGGDRDDARYFYAFFDFPASHDGAYRTHRAGTYLAMIALDTEHTAPNLTGSTDQETWLDGVLSGPETHKVPVYHVSHNPTYRDRDGAQQTRLRTHLAPRFEAAGLPVVFDAHEHIYARTVPIKDNQEDPDGVTYLGQGPITGSPREETNGGEWWIEEFYDGFQSNTFHTYDLLLHSDGLTVESVNRHETTFHTWGEPLPDGVPGGFRAVEGVKVWNGRKLVPHLVYVGR